MPHFVNFRALCVATIVTFHSKFRTNQILKVHRVDAWLRERVGSSILLYSRCSTSVDLPLSSEFGTNQTVGLGFQVEVLQPCKVVPFSLGQNRLHVPIALQLAIGPIARPRGGPVQSGSVPRRGAAEGREAASERSGNKLKGFKDSCARAKARIWP